MYSIYLNALTSKLTLYINHIKVIGGINQSPERGGGDLAKCMGRQCPDLASTKPKIIFLSCISEQSHVCKTFVQVFKILLIIYDCGLINYVKIEVNL